MTLHISREQAQRFLALYHFTPTDVAGTIERLATVQYDPLNPVGRNPDLVFQARVPGYQVDDWQKAAYNERLIYDAWDKMACLVPVSDWPMRALIREKYQPYHDREILQAEAEAAHAILETIDAIGPLSSLEFEDRQRVVELYPTWYGQTRTKRILRALWACGLLVTHHRKSGRHYYERPERVIPAEHFQRTPVLDGEEYHRWIMTRRQQAMGLFPRTAEAAIWSSCGNSAENKLAIAQLVEEGVLTPVLVGEKKLPYYILTSTLDLLDVSLPTPRMILLGPLDSMLWDRKTLRYIFDFDYVWEVYKPEKLRRWGYYVLPVFYGDRFVARLDSRLEKGVWTIARWWWEDDVSPDAGMLDALRVAVERFIYYLRADGVIVGEGVDERVREAVVGIAAI
ncbi:MAG: winged helix-turn-helix domain-containing protein [Chloroflexi bacterium]|nr:MAG: winged helix-turn-helix domain-containing protein [Chloroflexota bacterium]